MKRHQESSDHSQSFGKRRRDEGFSSTKVELAPGMVELRFLLTNKEAGAVIGTRGDYIKSIREKYDAALSIKDKGTPERMLIIVCKVDQVKDCCNDAFQKLDDDKKTEKLEIRMLVHLSHSGAIIGHGGSRINELRQKSELQIKVFRECCPCSTDRIIRLMGPQDKICEVIESLVYFMEQNPIEGPQRKYDTANCNPDAANDYGGFGQEEYFAGKRGVVYSHSDNNSFSRSSPSLHSHGHRSDNPVRNFGRSASGHYDVGTVSEQFSIPDELGGVVIGERGSRIKSARQESGAQIQVANANGDGDRIITVTGTPEQNQIALYMMQQSIRSSEFGRQYLQDG